MRGRWSFVILALIFVFASQSVLAQVDSTRPVGLSDAVYAASLSALTILFVTAVVLESAFATIFNWRVFLAYFSSRGVKTIVMVVVSLIVVYVFKLDVVASLIAAYKMPAAGDAPMDDALYRQLVNSLSGPVSKIVTALVLAGGSAGVNNLLTALGFRSPRDAEIVSTPPQDEAWVAVRVRKMNAVGEVQVVVSKVDALAAGEIAPPAIAGSIGFARPRLKDLLLRNLDRFPQNGGYVVRPNVPYRIVVEGKDAKGDPLKRLDGRYYVFAPRAIVDFNVSM